MNARELLNEFEGFLPSDDNKFIVEYIGELGYISIHNDEETGGYYSVCWDDGFGGGDYKNFKDAKSVRSYLSDVRRILKNRC